MLVPLSCSHRLCSAPGRVSRSCPEWELGMETEAQTGRPHPPSPAAVGHVPAQTKQLAAAAGTVGAARLRWGLALILRCFAGPAACAPCLLVELASLHVWEGRPTVLPAARGHCQGPEPPAAPARGPAHSPLPRPQPPARGPAHSPLPWPRPHPCPWPRPHPLPVAGLQLPVAATQSQGVSDASASSRGSGRRRR